MSPTNPPTCTSAAPLPAALVIPTVMEAQLTVLLHYAFHLTSSVKLPRRDGAPRLRGGRRKTRVQPLPQDTCESTAGAGGMVVPRTRPARKKSFARSISWGTEVQWPAYRASGSIDKPSRSSAAVLIAGPRVGSVTTPGRRSSWGYDSSGWGPTSARFLARRPTRKRHGEPRLMH